MKTTILTAATIVAIGAFANIDAARLHDARIVGTLGFDGGPRAMSPETEAFIALIENMPVP